MLSGAFRMAFVGVPPSEWMETAEQISAALNYLEQQSAAGKSIAFDTETSGLDITKDRALLLSLSDGKRRFACDIRNHRENDHLKNFLADSSITKTATRAKFDMHMMANVGMPVEGPIEDTITADWLYDENRQGRHGLKECTRDYFGLKMASFKEVFQPRKGTAKIPKESAGEAIDRALNDPTRRQKVIDYAGLDAFGTAITRDFLRSKLVEENLTDNKSLWRYYQEVEVPFTRVLYNMERRGFAICAGHLRTQIEPMKMAMGEIEDELTDLVGYKINPKSSKQLREHFFNLKKYEPLAYSKGGKTGVKQATTNEKSLRTWATKEKDRVAQLVLEHRNLSKAYGTYIIGLIKRLHPDPYLIHRIHTTLNQVGTVTGRLSSTDPNLQNIPALEFDDFLIRHAFIAPPGKRLLVLDYDQLEMKIMAHFSQDPKMISAILEGMDLHCFTVSMMLQVPYEEVFEAKEAKERFKRGLGPKPTERQKYLLNQRTCMKRCIHPHSLVITPDGVQSAAGAFSRFHAESQPSSAGVALSANAQVWDGRGAFTPVTHLYAPSTQPGVHVVATRGILTCSATHPFKLNDGRLVEASKLQKGDTLPETVVPLAEDRQYVPITYKLFKGVPPIIIPLSHEIAYFAGLFAGDGAQGGAHTVSISHGEVGKRDATGVEYADWQKIISATTSSIGLDPRSKNRRVYLGSRHTQLYLNALGLMDGSKRLSCIPDWVLSAGQTSILHFLGGLLDTDGTVRKDGVSSITTKQATFAGQLCLAARAAGLAVYAEPSFNVTYQRWYYRVCFTGSNGPKLRNFLRHPGKRSRLRDSAAHAPSAANTIRQVIPAGDISTLDLTVEAADHLYSTNGLLTHNTGFGIIYGIGPTRLAAQLSEDLGEELTKEQGMDLIRGYFGVFPDVRKFIKSSHEFCRNNEFVRTIIGRYRRLPTINASGGETDEDDVNAKKIIAEAERQSVNSQIQGSAADIARLAMLLAEHDRTLRSLGTTLILQIHDELIFECEDNPEVIDLSLKRAKEIMEHPFGDYEMAVPLTVGGGSGLTWASAK